MKTPFSITTAQTRPPVTVESQSLRDHFHAACRRRPYAKATEAIYWGWVQSFWKFHGKRPLRELGAEEVRDFLNSLATDNKSAPSTQNQALAALLFLYADVYDKPLPFIHGLVWSQKPQRLPEVFTQDEAARVLSHLNGVYQLQAGLMYGSGLRRNEVITLRVKDLDFGEGVITVRQGKGAKDRRVPMPPSLVPALESQLRYARGLWNYDLSDGMGAVELPFALAKKYPHAARSWGWQFVFPSQKRSINPETGETGRWHVFPDGVQRAVKKAICLAGITKHASCHTFRHSFATHLLESGENIRQVQELMGHKDIRTTMIYLHVMEHGAKHVTSPLERIQVEGLSVEKSERLVNAH